MNFRLNSLISAFTDAKYQKQQSRYKLFGFICATRADNDLLPALLAYFKELHDVTGSNVLLIAPSVDMLIRGREPTAEQAIAVLRSGMFPTDSMSTIGSKYVGDQVDKFLTSLTDQTHELTKFLGVETGQLPCMLFFERLLFPLEFVRWDLRGKSAERVVFELRLIMDDLSRRSDLDDEISSAMATTHLCLLDIEQRVATEMASKTAALRARLNDQTDALVYLTSLGRLRENCEDLLVAQGPDEQVDLLRRNLEWICGEPDNQMWIKFVRRLRRKWVSTSPDSFMEAFDQFLNCAPTTKTKPGDWVPIGHTIEDHIAFTKKAIEDTRFNLEQGLMFAERAPAAERQKLVDELERLRVRNENIEPPFSVLRSYGMLDGRNASRPAASAQSTPLTELFEYLSCFISYSSRDAEFAERLHSDLEKAGVRCWFAPNDLRIGDKFRQKIDESIRAHEKLLLLLSAGSINSDWVASEVESAFELERRERRMLLLPIKLDNEVEKTTHAWACEIRRQRHIGDFTGANDESTYQRALTRLLRDMRRESATSPS